MPKEKKDKDKSSIVCYEYKKSKSECLDLEKSQDKKKFFKTKEKKVLMSSGKEDLDNTSSNEDNEEAHICLMTNTTSEEFESD